MRSLPVMEIKRKKTFHTVTNRSDRGSKVEIFSATPFASHQKPVQRQDRANNAAASSYQNSVVVRQARKSVQIAKGRKEK